MPRNPLYTQAQTGCRLSVGGRMCNGRMTAMWDVGASAQARCDTSSISNHLLRDERHVYV
jgi:hypothetical protein